MHLDVARRFLADRRTAWLGWGLGVVVYTGLMMALWPTIRDSEGYQNAAEDLPEAFDALFGPGGIDLGSPEGYLNTYVFGMMIPLMMIVAGISAGAAIIAGEEEDGTLELLLSHPVSRRRVALEKSTAVLAYLALFAVLCAGVIIGLGPAVDMDVDAGNVAAASLGAWLAAAVYALVAVTTGAATGRRGASAGLAGGLAGLGYLLMIVAELADGLSGLRYLSPLYLANGSSPVENGIPGGYYLALVAVIGVLVGAAVVALRRRDLRA
ncbi:MAG: ABC transporter permease subunit [Ilumatobacteraceae bacterium]